MKNGVFRPQVKSKFGHPRGVFKQQNLSGTPLEYSLSIVSCLLWDVCVTVVVVLVLTE